MLEGDLENEFSVSECKETSSKALTTVVWHDLV